jgi:hypothetical protein
MAIIDLTTMQRKRASAINNEIKAFWQEAIDNYFFKGTVKQEFDLKEDSSHV